MLVVHHLRRSQSERIVWLCEELGVPYDLRMYERDKGTLRAPPAYRSLHPTEAAPVIFDGELVLAESGAIVEYVSAVHGEGRLFYQSSAPEFPAHLYWFHFSNGTLQPALARAALVRRILAEGHPEIAASRSRADRALEFVDARLAERDYLAGNELSAADIMTVYSLTTMRLYAPFDVSPYRNICVYLARIGRRPGYQRAMQVAGADLIQPPR